MIKSTLFGHQNVMAIKHLYLYKVDGTLVRQITQGEWIVESIKSIDEDNGLIYFSGRADTPLESHLYSAKLFEKIYTSSFN